MTEMCPYILSHHVWGFLQHSLSGSARQTFKNTKRRDGLNVWRLLVLEVNSQTHCRRAGLRDRVQFQQQVTSIDHIRTAVAAWESVYNEYLEAGGPPMEFEDRRSQYLRILPTTLRREVFRELSDFKSMAEIKEWVRVQTELEREWEIDDASRRRPGARAANLVEVDEMTAELNALGMNLEDGMSDEVLAIFKKSSGGNRRPGAPGAKTQTRGPPAGTKPKCANCLREGHTAQECRTPKLDQSKRLCFDCDLPGHQARNCPSKGKVPVKAIEDGDVAANALDV
jgi:hypothetical protein